MSRSDLARRRCKGISFPPSISPDAVGRPLEVVVPPGLHEGQVESLRGRLNMVGGESGGWTENRDNPRLNKVAQLFTRLKKS